MSLSVDQRIRIEIIGAVQGVGFRPFIYQLATQLDLVGWVSNTSSGVTIEAQGSPQKLENFLTRIPQEKPPHAFIQSFKYVYLDAKEYHQFEIKESEGREFPTAIILPDIATCTNCLKEIFDPSNRRYLYPFTNCTHCGPRYSIVERLPYDRHHTSMKTFTMCPDCHKEYEDPTDRRFHAQPNACSACGPHVELWDNKGNVLASHDDVFKKVIRSLSGGKIVAVKGLGGFHLICDAQNDKSVKYLRERKHREEKPLALMFPDVETINLYCHVSEKEQLLLNSPEAPIVLLEKKKDDINLTLAPSIAPQNPNLGVMRPYTPLHHILLKEWQKPIVATSGNLSDEPICIDNTEALKELGSIADVFLVHNRPIVRHVDDSIVRIVMDRPLVYRRARGYAPLPVLLKEATPGVLALGAHLKNTVALSIGKNVFISQHIGDMETEKSLETFDKTIHTLRNLYHPSLEQIVCDNHPEYLSTKQAPRYGIPIKSVQHHHAHIASCMAENHLDKTVLGVSWDGTGWGDDGTIWGGEFLISSLDKYVRIGHLKTFRLPGAEAAIHEPRRSALGLLFEIFGEEAFSFKELECLKAFDKKELKIVREMLQKNVNCPVTSSMGRLFDAVASLIGVGQKIRFEGQVAMDLEFAIGSLRIDEMYSFAIEKKDDTSVTHIVDYSAMIREIIKDFQNHVSMATISAKFHNTLAEFIVAMAPKVALKEIVLSGGCFQNKYLMERSVKRLKEEGYCPYWHQTVPPNDGGISLGQAVVGASQINKSKNSNIRI